MTPQPQSLIPQLMCPTSPTDPVPGPPSSPGAEQKGAGRCQHGWVLVEHAEDSFQTWICESFQTLLLIFQPPLGKRALPESCLGAALWFREKSQADAGMEEDALKALSSISQCCWCQLGLASCSTPGAQRRCWLLLWGLFSFLMKFFYSPHLGVDCRSALGALWLWCGK